jgi:hypothetical protein
VFCELVGPVPLSAGTYGFITTPLDDANFTSLVVGSSGSPIAGTMTHPDGREELVVTVASGPFSRHMHLLGSGMLDWATRGRRLGHSGFFLSVHVDDVLLGAPLPPDAAPIRMTRSDVVRAAAWSLDTGVRLDFAYNAWGSVTATAGGASDPLTEALVEYAGEFNWLNHTFDHLDLDDASEQEIRDEITRNLQWATDNRIPVERDSLVTGAHSGLDNPAMAAASTACGVRWIAADASLDSGARVIGAARTVPRHPVNIPLDISTREQLSHRPAPASYGAIVGTIEQTGQLLVMEAGIILDHLLSNDPRPHFAHQNGLVDDRLLLGLLDVVLQSYRELIALPPKQLSLAAAGRELARRERWASALAAGLVAAHLVADVVQITNRSNRAVEAPIMASSGGSAHTGVRGRWIGVAAGQTITLSE